MESRSLRSDIVDCIDDFIEKGDYYNNKIGTVVKAKKTEEGFLCIVTIKKVLCDNEKTICRSAMKVVCHDDLDVLKRFFKYQFKFIRRSFQKLK